VDVSELFPSPSTAVLFLIYTAAHTENQRSRVARKRGLQGSNELFGTFADISGFFSIIFSLVFFIAYWYDTGISSAGALLILSIVIAIIYHLISASIFGDSFIVWMAGTIAIWPMMFALIPRVTWFGVFG